MLKTTIISPVNGNDLPVKWASKAGILPSEAVQIIIQSYPKPETLGVGEKFPESDFPPSDPDSSNLVSSYLLRCKLFQNTPRKSEHPC